MNPPNTVKVSKGSVKTMGLAKHPQAANLGPQPQPAFPHPPQQYPGGSSRMMMQSNQFHGIGLNTQSNFAIIGSNQPSQLSNMSDGRGGLKPLGH